MSDIDLSKITLKEARILWEYVSKARDSIKPEPADFAAIEKLQDAIKIGGAKEAEKAEIAMVEKVAIAMFAPLEAEGFHPSASQCDEARRVIALVRDDKAQT